MGALESSIETLRVMKSKMVDTGAPQHEMHWALGSLVTTLTANLLQICNKVIADSMTSDDASVQHDLRLIQSEFNEFMDRMIGND